MVGIQFYAMRGIKTFGRMLRMSLATLLHHYRWIVDNLSFNHVVLTSSSCFRDIVDLKRVEECGWIEVTYPWNDRTISFSG
jgi:hypothetical protein